jgi:hypothetical protein
MSTQIGSEGIRVLFSAQMLARLRIIQGVMDRTSQTMVALH